MDISCSAQVCPVILNATCVFYEGETLVYTGIVTDDNLQTALQKIDAKFQDAGLGYIFNNGVIQTSPGQPVGLGGTMIQDTTIDGDGYTLTFTGTLLATKFATVGGTSSQFVKGDGTLDSTSYQPAGNYITALTGDGTATGPGSVAFTLATVNGNPGTFGSGVRIPIVTANAKGLITNITSTPINLPSDSLSFVGDVTGSGVTGAPVTLTLQTVNSNIYTSNNFLKFAVNVKGLVTSATPVTDLDIEGVLGYTPVPESRTLTINGVTYDLSANRNWGTIDGTSGTSGAPGTSGTSGRQGTSGTSGATGTSGTSGIGSDGTSGTSGVSNDGTSGTSGVTGADGTAGTSGASSTTTFTVLNANVTNSTTTGAKVTGLDTALTTGTYWIQAYILYQSTVTTTGVKFGINNSGTATIAATLRWGTTGTTATTNAPTMNVTGTAIMEHASTIVETTTAPNLGPSLSVNAANSNMLAVIDIYMNVTVAGNLELWHGSETAAATSVRAGTSFFITKVL